MGNRKSVPVERRGTERLVTMAAIVPCEFCSHGFSVDDIALHQSKCRPDLLHYGLVGGRLEPAVGVLGASETEELLELLVEESGSPEAPDVVASVTGNGDASGAGCSTCETKSSAQMHVIPCEFCAVHFPVAHIVIHQSRCRPDLLHYSGTKEVLEPDVGEKVPYNGTKEVLEPNVGEKVPYSETQKVLDPDVGEKVPYSGTKEVLEPDVGEKVPYSGTQEVLEPDVGEKVPYSETQEVLDPDVGEKESSEVKDTYEVRVHEEEFLDQLKSKSGLASSPVATDSAVDCNIAGTHAVLKADDLNAGGCIQSSGVVRRKDSSDSFVSIPSDNENTSDEVKESGSSEHAAFDKTSSDKEESRGWLIGVNARVFCFDCYRFHEVGKEPSCVRNVCTANKFNTSEDQRTDEDLVKRQTLDQCDSIPETPRDKSRSEEALPCRDNLDDRQKFETDSSTPDFRAKLSEHYSARVSPSGCNVAETRLNDRGSSDREEPTVLNSEVQKRIVVEAIPYELKTSETSVKAPNVKFSTDVLASVTIPHEPETSENSVETPDVLVAPVPCEFCSKQFYSNFIVEHQSGCRPDLLHFSAGEHESEQTVFGCGKDYKCEEDKLACPQTFMGDCGERSVNNHSSVIAPEGADVDLEPELCEEPSVQLEATSVQCSSGNLDSGAHEPLRNPFVDSRADLNDDGESPPMYNATSGKDCFATNLSETACEYRQEHGSTSIEIQCDLTSRGLRSEYEQCMSIGVQCSGADFEDTWRNLRSEVHHASAGTQCSQADLGISSESHPLHLHQAPPPGSQLVHESTSLLSNKEVAAGILVFTLSLFFNLFNIPKG